MDQLLTVLIQTSPLPSHPSTALLEALFRSFDKVDGLREASIYILCDGCGESTAQLTDEGAVKQEAEPVVVNLKHGRAPDDVKRKYRLHLDTLETKLAFPPFLSPMAGGTLRLVRLPTRHGSACAIRAAFDMGLITTPFVMVAQHDNIFIRKVPLRSALHTMEANDWVKTLHFQATATVNYVEKVRKRYGMDLSPMVWQEKEGDVCCGHPLVPLAFWYGRTAVSRTDYYVNFVLNRPLEIGDHLEELLGVTQLREMQNLGPKVAHPKYGNYVLDQGEEVLYHLSGRKVRSSTTTKSAPDDSGCEGKGKGESCFTLALTKISRCEESFTTAQSARAFVPGLELIQDPTATLGSNSVGLPPKGRFKQRCFHCGVKGHSYRWCPTRKQPSVTETIHLP